MGLGHTLGYILGDISAEASSEAQISRALYHWEHQNPHKIKPTSLV